MKKLNIFKTLVKNNGLSQGRELKGRRARLEELEDRRLLSVTAAEYEAIRTAYADFELPASMDEINVIEITAENLTAANLQSAVNQAAATTSDDLIVVRTTADAHSVTFTAAGDEILFRLDSAANGSLTLVGFGTAPLTVNAASCSRVLTVGAESDVRLGNLIVTGGSSATSASYAGYGGGIYNAGTLTLADISVTANASSYSGGGIFNSGILTAKGLEITDNTASAYYYAYGGGVYNAGTIVAENLLLADNAAQGTSACGGGVYNWTGRLTLTGATVSGNHAVYGGGIDVYGSSSSRYVVTLHNTVLTGNTASAADGGADVYRFNAKGTISAGYVLSDYAGWNTSESVFAYDSAKPLFADASAGNYAPATNSQIIDIGKNAFVTTSTDLAGKNRIVNATEGETAIVDLGAYEYQSAEAPSAIVTTNLDIVDEFDGLISLREAIAYVTSGAVTGTRITFSADVFTGGSANVITLGGTELAVTAQLSIDASALSENVTISGNDASRVLNISAGTEETPISLLGLNIMRGKSAETGGGILLAGVVSAVRCVVKGNVSESGGGGVYVSSGGFYALNSEISANAGTGGGGIYNAAGTVTTVNCSIAGNASSGYGGGVSNWGSFLALNTVIAENYGTTNADWFGLEMTTGSGNNLVGFDAFFTVAPVFNEEGTLINADELDLTLTASSWGIDRGDNTQITLSADLAGRTRFVKSWASIATVDIGAYEYQDTVEKNVETPSTTVTTELDVINDTDGLISLREAIGYATSGGTIRFAEALAGKTITLDSAALMVNKILTIDASSLSSGITLDANGKGSILLISSGTAENPVILKNLTFTGGNSYDGGAIINSGIVSITGCVFSENTGTYGAGIFNYHGSLTIDGSDFSKNTVGGAIYNYYGTLSVTESNFSENGSNRGGAVYNAAGTVTLADSVFDKNTANYGGGVYNVSGNTAMTRCSVTDNQSYYGGGICNYGGTLTGTDLIITGNTGVNNGGGIYNYLGTTTITDSLLTGNTGNFGGAICVDEGTLTATGCTVAGNTGNYGGGIFLYGVTSTDTTSKFYNVSLNNSILVGNTASKAGADVHRYNDLGTINADHTLSTFTEWSNAATATNYLYKADDPLFTNVAEGDYTLAPGSQAIDLGANTHVTTETDLAGGERIVHEIVDLGAFEFQRHLETPSAVVTTHLDVIDDRDGLISLREAILYVATDQTDTTTITFASTLKGRTITLDAELGALSISSPLTIDGSAIYQGVTVSANETGRVLNVLGGTSVNPVKLVNLKITGGKSSENGGGIQNGGTLTLVNCLVVGNESAANGGGIYNAGTLTTVGTTVTGNRAANGGGLYAGNAAGLPSSVQLENSIFVGNTLNDETVTGVDIARSTRGELNGQNTLSTFSAWDNADDDETVNYVYNSSLSLFADAAAGDYSLAADSQAIDKGENNFVIDSTFDLAKGIRIVNRLVDLGAFEYQLNADPGDTLETAQTAEFIENTLLYRDMIGNGSYGDKDVDLFALTITEANLSEILSLAVGCPEGGTEVAVILRLFDATGKELGSSSTGTMSWTPSEAGTYYLGISASANASYDPTKTDDRPSGATGDYLMSALWTERTPMTAATLSDAPLCVASILTVSTEPEDATFTYQWLRGTDAANMTAIEGATGSYYEIQTADAGCYIGVSVTGYGQYIGTVSAVSDGVVASYEKSLVVNSLGDTADPTDGLTTLREAIAYAEAEETITFAASLDGETITLSDYALTVAKTLTINASGLTDGITVSGNEKTQVFIVTGGTSSQNVELINLTVTKGSGYSGGAIYNAGYLTLVDSAVTQSAAYYGGAIFNYGSTTGGSVTLHHSTLSGNTATNGGGIWNAAGYVVMSGSLITGNSATFAGGIYNYGGSVTSSNDLIVSNQATYGGGFCNDEGYMMTLNSTITGNSASNGGGIYNFGYSTDYTYLNYFYNTVLAGNIATQAGNDVHNDTAFGTSYAFHSLSSYTTWDNAEIEGVINFVYDSTLPLFTDAAHGDFSLAASSQAIDRGDNLYVRVSADYAQNKRIVNEIVDIGAYEYQLNADSGDTLAAARTVTLTEDAYSYEEAIGNGAYGLKDVDVYALSATETEVNSHWILTVSASTDAASFGAVLRIFDSTGTEIASKTGPSGAPLTLVWTPTTVGTYYFAVSGAGNVDYDPTTTDGRSDGETGDYVFAVARAEKLPLEGVTLAYDTETLNFSTTITATVTPSAAVQSGSVTYQWFRGTDTENMTAITEATSATYTVTFADAGCYLKVTATGSGDYTGTVSVTTAEAVPVIVKTGIVDTADDVIDWTDSAMSLREAIILAAPGDTITFAESMAGKTITLSAALGQLEITQSLTIDAKALYDSDASAPGVTINAGAGTTESRRVFFISGDSESPITVALSGLTITGGRIDMDTVEADGGGIYAIGADLTLQQSLVKKNRARAHSETADVFAAGGGIYVTDGTLTLIDSSVTENALYAESTTGYAQTLGGGIRAEDTVRIIRSTVSGNSASCGGGIYLESGMLTVSDSVISANKSTISSDVDNVTASGGGIYAVAGIVSVVGTRISGNSVTTSSETGTAGAYGGGIFTDGASLVLNNVILSGNLAKAASDSSETVAVGGGVYSNAAVTVTDSLIVGNTANADGNTAEAAGGGIGVTGNLTLNGATIADNTAVGVADGTPTVIGGGLYVFAGTATVRNSVIVLNTAADGADVYRRTGATVNAFHTLSGFSTWDNSQTEGVTNFVYDAAEPLFTDQDGADYTLAENSQAIDIGNNDYAVYPDGTAITTDLAGNRRISNRVVDLGAYEFQADTPDPLDAPDNLATSSYGGQSVRVTWDDVTGAAGYRLAWSTDQTDWTTADAAENAYTVAGLTYGAVVYYKVMALGDDVSYTDSVYSASVNKIVCPMDIDGDGRIGPADRAFLSQAWFSSSSSANWDPRCDIDGDGKVGPSDRNYLSANWLKSSSASDLVYPSAVVEAALLDFVNEETMDDDIEEEAVTMPDLTIGLFTDFLN